jgi:hypothetical protein
MLVDGAQSHGDSDGEALQGGAGQRAVFEHGGVQGGAVDVLGGDPGRVGVHIGVEHRRGAEPGHPAGRGHLPPQPFPQLWVGCVLSPDQLDRRRGAGFVGAAQVNHTHATGPEPPLDPVPPDIAGWWR